MTAQTILPANSVRDTGYNVENSLRFNKASSDHLKRTPSSDGNKTTNTISFWVKRGKLAGGVVQRLFSQLDTGGAGNPDDYITFGDNDTFIFQFYGDGSNGVNNGYLVTNRVFRDTSAWYHIVAVQDTTNGTSGNRLRIYINGVRETSFSTANYPDQNTPGGGINDDGYPLFIGQRGNNAGYFDGYMSEVCFIDGQALEPTSFGEFDEDSGIWKPLDGLADDLTFGTNGFYLEFKQSGTGTNASGVGADTSGNNHHFIVNNLTAADQSTDTCTNNFCTWNPLDTFYSGNTYQEGNTQGTKPNDSVESFGTSTFGMSSGKWYAEFKVISFSGSNSTISFGIIDRPSVRNDMQISKYAYGIAYLNNGYLQANDGATHNVNTETTFGAGDIIGVYIDIDNLEIYFAKNGTILNSGTGLAIQPLSSTANGVYFFAFDNFAAGGSVHQANWGNPAYTGTDKSDANGYGSFEYDPSSGTFDGVSKDFYALCTKNLAEYG